MSSTAAAKVATPALVMQILAGLTIFFGLVSIVLNVLGVGMGSMGGGDERISQMMSGGIGIASAALGILFNGFIIFGAQKMKNLEAFPLALVAAILMLLPCNCPCCFVNMPVGIWALVTLLNAEVKASFR